MLCYIMLCYALLSCDVCYSQVALGLCDNAYEIKDILYTKLIQKLYDLACECGMYFLAQMAERIPSWFGERLYSFIYGDNRVPPGPERSSREIAEEVYSTCIMGLTIGILVQLAIYLFYPGITLMLINSILYVVQFLLDKFYISITMYWVFVVLISIAIVVIHVRRR